MPESGRYYSASGGFLCVFVTPPDELPDLGVFPRGLGLFEADSAWRLSPWSAICEGVPQESLRLAEVVLKMEGHVRVELSREAAEEYFRSGAPASLAGKRMTVPLVVG